MKYSYHPYEPKYFATALRRENGAKNLKWDCARGQDTFIVQTPFGVDATTVIEELCITLSSMDIQQNKYAEVFPGIWVRYVTAAEKAKAGGCPINTEASTYTVFGCSRLGDDCHIYAPQNQAMISPFCHIPMEIHVDIIEDTKPEGVAFWKRITPTGFYKVSFPSGFADGYKDGDLVYKVAKMNIPITKQMLVHGTVYIKSKNRPQIVSTNKGLRLK